MWMVCQLHVVIHMNKQVAALFSLSFYPQIKRTSVATLVGGLTKEYNVVVF